MYVIGWRYENPIQCEFASIMSYMHDQNLCSLHMEAFVVYVDMNTFGIHSGLVSLYNSSNAGEVIKMLFFHCGS